MYNRMASKKSAYFSWSLSASLCQSAKNCIRLAQNDLIYQLALASASHEDCLDLIKSSEGLMRTFVMTFFWPVKFSLLRLPLIQTIKVLIRTFKVAPGALCPLWWRKLANSWNRFFRSGQWAKQALKCLPYYFSSHLRLIFDDTLSVNWYISCQIW